VGVNLRGRVVTPRGVLDDTIVVLRGERIAELRPAGPTEREDLRPGWILPGFVDIHVHGGGGFSFTTGAADQARGAAAFHARHGTTTLLASLVTAAPPALRAALRSLAPLVDEGLLAGVHLEGPYLSPVRCGAQNPAYLRDPDTAELATLLESGIVGMVTLAPELPGALDAVRLLVDRGVLAAVGHTDATYEQTMAAVVAGAGVATHLGNAMRPIHHRAPGPIIALLDAPGVVCEQVADGVHLHEGMLRHVFRTAGPDRVALVTDAMAAAGRPDGDYDLGDQSVTVSAGVARLTRDGAIAGSTLTMDAAFRRTVHNGVSVVDAARMAATTPARVIGLGDQVGAVEAGLRADLVLLDQELHVTAVLRGGEPIPLD
jgi:N-acetylglucosamine-6-phosphate deacetylase